MGLLPQDNTTPLPPKPGHPSDADFANARTLYEAVVRKGLLMRRVKNLIKWANYFRLLRSNNIPPERIKSAVDWYAAHAGEKYVPVICSAESFLNKFPQLENAMRIAAEIQQRDKPTYVETPLGEKVYGWAIRFNWPAGSGEKLRPAVEQSIINFQEFVRQINDWRKACVIAKGFGDGKLLRLYRYSSRLLSDLGSVESFNDRWWGSVFKSVKTWKGWSGDVMSFVYRPDHRIAASQARDSAKAYCGEGRRYDELLAAIGVDGGSNVAH